MNMDPMTWLLLNFLSIIILAFYSMMEMACVSFNKIRLQYYVAKGDNKAKQLNYLLHHPAKLFGTTLIGVNIALVVGAECSREFYTSIGLDPDFAPITQVFLVVIFGELAPMFAARHYPEHVAMLGIPLIYASFKMMQPLLWLVHLVTQTCNKFIGKNEQSSNIYLSQEELQKILEEREEISSNEVENNFGVITRNILSLKRKTMIQIMEPIIQAIALPSNAVVQQMEDLLIKTELDYVYIYEHNITKIVAIAYPRDALRAGSSRRLREYSRPPWFVSETTTIMQLIKQFRTNHESVAIILDKSGKAIGSISLDNVLEEIFGKI